MRRHVLAVAVLLPSLTVLSWGCGSDDPPVEDLCGWLADPDNCYREFFEDIGARCGAAGEGNGPEGSFLARDALDVCILSEGGQVIFDPPLEPADFPPEEQSFIFINLDGTTCGQAITKNEFDFSMQVEPDEGATEEGASSDLVYGGQFSQQTADGRETLSTSCPADELGNSETHFFDKLQVTKCREYEELLPRIELELNAGGIELEGFAKFRIYYPPTEGDLANAEPVVVEYFNCSIPGLPPPCFNGVQDGNETDEDCGGNEDSCATRCEAGQLCIEDSDCVETATCEFELGIKKCIEPG